MIQTTTISQRLEALVLRLKALGIASPQQLEQAKHEQANTQERFSVILTKLGIIRDAEIGKRLAPQLGWMAQRLEPAQVSLASASGRIPLDVCRAHHLAPINEPQPGHVVVATDDPFTLLALEWLERHCGLSLELVLVREQDFATLLARLDQPPQAAPAAAPVSSPPPPPPRTPVVSHPPPAVAPVAPGETKSSQGGDEADEPIIRLVDSMLTEAVRMRASDIHIEPLASGLKVRYRIDGALREVNSPPKALHGPITSRIKILAGLNIAEKRLPQDGRLQLTVEGKALDARISTLPALHGESIVMRLLDRSQAVRGLHELGLYPRDEHQWDDLIRRPYGMVLVTGPTGSGKTTTLYATLAALNRPDRKLITVEDPVEYQLSGVNQVHVKAAIGLSFAAGLRAILRQAPDVIMVGEIRDQETAQIAVQAALTGHLVFSTLHTNDAPSAVTRLVDMGIAPFLVASTIQGVLAQRLIRRICPSCQVHRPPTPEEQLFLAEAKPGETSIVTAAVGPTHVTEGKGCEQCHGSGYYGRIGIYELLCLSDALRQLIVAKSQASSLRQQAIHEGMRTLRDDGRTKVAEGLTTVAEVLRATPKQVL